MPTTSTTRRATDAALRRVPVVRSVGGPGEVREAAAVLDRARREEGGMRLVRDAAMAAPWAVLLLARLVRDSRVPLRYRAAIVVATTYMIFPIDPIPDFTPVIGALDDALVALVVVRWVLRNVDAELLDEHWSGTPEVLDALLALAGAGR